MIPICSSDYVFIPILFTCFVSCIAFSDSNNTLGDCSGGLTAPTRSYLTPKKFFYVRLKFLFSRLGVFIKNRLCGSPTPLGLPHSPVLQGPTSLIQWECAGGCTAFDCSTVRATSASRHSGAVEKKGRPPLPNGSAATYAMASLHNEQCVHRGFLHTRSLDLALCTHCKLVSQFVFSFGFLYFYFWKLQSFKWE